MAAYATTSDLAERVDIEVIGQLCTDDRTKLSRQDILSHPTIDTALESASGELEAALISGGRYTPTELSGLTGNALAYLKTLTCNLALAFLLRRRPGVHPELLEFTVKSNADALGMLRTGADLFGGLDSQVEAGVPKTDGPSAVKMDELNLLPTRMRRYFPNDEQRLPTRQA